MTVDQRNMKRVKRAELMVDAYAILAGDQAELMETVLTDLLADLMHLCDYKGVVFADSLYSAEKHHWAEVTGED